MKIHIMLAPCPGSLDKSGEYLSTDSLATVFSQYRHSANFTVGHYPAGAYCVTFCSIGQLRNNMQAGRVFAIPLQVCRYALFLDENLFPDCVDTRFVLRPLGQPDCNFPGVLIHHNQFPAHLN